MNNLSTIGKRLKSETPVFWKKIRYIMLACGSVGAGLATLPAEYALGNAVTILITIGTIGTALASMAVKDK